MQPMIDAQSRDSSSCTSSFLSLCEFYCCGCGAGTGAGFQPVASGREQSHSEAASEVRKLPSL